MKIGFKVQHSELVTYLTKWKGEGEKKLNLFFLVTDAKKIIKENDIDDQLGKMLREKKKM